VCCSVLQRVAVRPGARSWIHTQKNEFANQFANENAVMLHRVRERRCRHVTHTHTHSLGRAHLQIPSQKRPQMQMPSRHVYERVVLHLDKSCHTSPGSSNNVSHNFEGVMSKVNAACHICIRHVTYESGMSHMNASCRI